MSNIIGGFIGGWLIVDLTDGSIDWKGITKAPSFLALIAYALFMFFVYKNNLTNNNDDLMKYNNVEHIQAMLRKELIHDIIRIGREKMKNGEIASIDEIEKMVVGQADD